MAKITSEEMYERAVKVIPGGVTRPLRYFAPYPFYVKKAYGSKLVDFEGRTLTDFWMAHGALVLGHVHPAIVRAAKEQLKIGCHYGLCNEWEVKLAEQVTKLVPSVEMVAFANSGNEANMHAIMLARAYTKRDKIGKFEGAFQGVLEPLHVGVHWPIGEPESAGQDPLSTKNTVLLPSDNPEMAYETIRKEKLACVIFELLVGGATFPVQKDFAKGLVEVCKETGTLLIADEVITGFRLSRGGAQQVFGITPDLTTFGKAIGGGEFPVGAVGGRAEVMELMDSRKHAKSSELVMRGGTYVGNPLVMRTGYEATKIYEKNKVYQHIDKLGDRLKKGLQEAVEETDANAHVTGLGSVYKLYFLNEKITKFDLKSLGTNMDIESERKYFHHLISKGILAMTPTQGHFYISLPHTKEEIDRLITATEEFLKS